MKLLIHFKHGGCSEITYETKEAMMANFDKLKKANFNKGGKFISSRTIIPHNEIKFVEIIEN
ncbi:TPA: hypothetical protein ACGXK1_005043 [Bacillus cereus]